MKKTLLVCFGLVIFIPLTSIAVDIAHKVGVVVSTPLTVQNIQNLSFGAWNTLAGWGINVVVSANSVSGKHAANSSDVTSSSLLEGHAGIIKVTGYGQISIQSTPPTTLIHTTDSTKILQLSNMKIVNSDGSTISNMNRVVLDGIKELKTIGQVSLPETGKATKGEYKADWPITIIYTYEPE